MPRPQPPSRKPVHLGIPSNPRIRWNYLTASLESLKIYNFDITFATLSTADRLQGLETILSRWSGLITLAFYVKNVQTDLIPLQELYRSNPEVARRVTVHLFGDHGHLLSKSYNQKLLLVVPSFELVPPGAKYPRVKGDTGALEGLTIPPLPADPTLPKQVKCLEDLLKDMNDEEFGDRNILGGGTSENGIGKKRRCRPIGPGYLSRRGKWVSRKTNKRQVIEIPDNFSQVKGMLVNYEMRAFHARCYLCQNTTDLAKWIWAKSAYFVETEPQFIPEPYEPYVVISNRSLIPWNENFNGYGRDKTLYYYELRNLLRFKTAILSNVFIVHKEHERSEDASKFREKYSLRYRVSRLLKYDKEQDLLDLHYASLNKLPPHHENYVHQRLQDREKRNKAYQKIAENVSIDNDTDTLELLGTAGDNVVNIGGDGDGDGNDGVLTFSDGRGDGGVGVGNGDGICGVWEGLLGLFKR
ncbi:Glycosyltransferase-like 1B [Blyttiomyces sp. JEL0837]|nr:Glycosyltransferase-like 1B [Blyttiomyces sp. JEL0837]